MTEDGSYPIDTDKDLTQYVNKQITVTGMLEHHTKAAPAATSGDAAVVTDIRLRIVASVVGDCNKTPK
jgi:hypothetical protein